MALVLPALDVHTSTLLQAAMDEHFFTVWGYEKDGAYPTRRAVKDEVELRVSEIQQANSVDALFEAAESDRPFMQGSSFRGPQPYSRDEGTRPIAFRELECLISDLCWKLDKAALQDPSRTDRACHFVPGLFDALSARDGLLPLRSDMIPRTFSDDRYIFFSDYAVFAHPEIIGARELTADLWRLAAKRGRRSSRDRSQPCC